MTRVRYCASSIAFAALALLVAVMLASCGTSASAKAPGQLPGQSAGKGTPASVEACDLLMSEDVAALLGTPVVEPTRSRGGDEIVVTDCSYKTAADPAGWASLMLRRASSADLASQEFRYARPALESNLGATTHDVAGLGDGAFWAVGQGVHQLTMLCGNVQRLITVRGSGVGTGEEAAVRLAHAALTRLP